LLAPRATRNDCPGTANLAQCVFGPSGVRMDARAPKTSFRIVDQLFAVERGKCLGSTIERRLGYATGELKVRDEREIAIIAQHYIEDAESVGVALLRNQAGSIIPPRPLARRRLRPGQRR